MSTSPTPVTEGGNIRRTAIVVGGGPAGLVAAARLAEGGAETTLLESSSRFGGRAASEREEGFDLNQGPHALYVGGPGMRELDALGIDPPRWNPVSHRSVFVRNGNVRRTMGGDAELAAWLLREVRRRDPEDLAGISVEEWFRRSIRSERARAAAGALVRVTTFVADHEALSAEIAARQIRIGLWPGVRYIKGGWQTLVDALAERARGHGATLRRRAAVRAIDRTPGGWSVTLDDEVINAQLLVVATGGPEAFAKLLGNDAPPAPGPAAEVSTLDLGLTRVPRKGRLFSLGIDEPDYLSRHSPPEMKDRALLSLASYSRQPREKLERMAETVQPGWRDHATLQRFLPRMVVISAIATPATGGLAGRPATDRGDGLFAAGDWIGPDGWLVDAAISSGASAAAAALRSPVEVPA